MSQRGEGWQAGDLALCIKLGGWVGIKFRKPSSDWIIKPKCGGYYTVDGVAHKDGVTGLYLKGFDQKNGNGLRFYWDASRFIKVTPPEADSFDHEVIEQMAGLPVDA